MQQCSHTHGLTAIIGMKGETALPTRSTALTLLRNLVTGNVAKSRQHTLHRTEGGLHMRLSPRRADSKQDMG